MGIPHVGTAWMIAPDVAVTNRHVALTFAQASSAGGYSFKTSPIGQPYRARVDFREEAAQTAPFEVSVTDIIYIAPSVEGAPDIAFLRLASPDGRPLPPPLELLDGDLHRGQVICAIGYPAEDPRNPFDDQARIFQGLFNIKRLAPGEIIGLHDGEVFSHDASTLGGSSGSVIIDVASGRAVGLHFAGLFERANWALSARGIQAVLGDLKAVQLPRKHVVKEAAEPVTPPDPATLRRRVGYRADFLGKGARRVPLPGLSEPLASAVTVVTPSRKRPARFILKYHHFSLAMHRDRRMALFAAVNIDGSGTRRLKRKGDPWKKDLRIPAEAQIGNELYQSNDLDRGHLVRRLDPAWGSSAEAAELDTFFYTNSTPQHSTFNQTLWVRLEDYLLDHADALGFRASVMTGPIFSETDPLYRGVHLPSAYWKVAAMLRPAGRALSVTGYIVSQSDLITGMEFVYGQFKTYQVPISVIESRTGLDFGDLKEADPLRSVEAAMPRELLTADDVVLG